MLEFLKEKIEGWTIEKVKAYNDNFFVPPLPKKSTFIQEEFEYGLCVYNEHLAKFYHNDGTTHLLIDEFSKDDWNIFLKLYEESLSGPLRMSRPIEMDYTRVNSREYIYMKFGSPTGEVGIPFFLVEEDNQFYKQYVDNITWLLKSLDKLELPFPNEPIGPIKFPKDDIGFYFCPLAGSENFYFKDYDKNYFIKSQMFKLSHAFQSGQEASLDNVPKIDWEMIKEYARQQWYPFRDIK